MAKIARPILHLDYETFSEVDLTKAGGHKYAMHESTDVNCLGYAFDDDKPSLWIPGQPIPERIEDHIICGLPIFAWNAQFERLITKHVMTRRYGWPEPATNQYYCVMVMVLAMGLPGQLAKAAPAVGLDIAKDSVGHRIMLQLCKPRKPTAKNPRTRFTRAEFPDKFARQDEYCLQDVAVEQQMLKRVVMLKQSEQELYWRDQEIQDRGCTIDLQLVGRACALVEGELRNLNEELRDITDGEVGSIASTKQLVDFLKNSGIQWPENIRPSVDRENIEKLLIRDDLTPVQRRAIEIRQEGSKTSTAKLDRALTQICDDGTVKGQLQFHGAATGRDAARGLQLQNLPRPSKATNVKQATRDIRDGFDLDLIHVFHGNPMTVIADCLRGVILPRKGHLLWTRDLSQIEARMTAYLAGQNDLVEAFQAYDRRDGPDIYIIAAAGIYDVPAASISEKDERRQTGKVSTLALGFGGGAGAFGSMAKIYRVDLEPMLPTVWGLIEENLQERALKAWRDRGRRSGMKKNAWLAAEAVKMKWRQENDAIVSYWAELEQAAIDAMIRPGETFSAGLIQYRKSGSWLRCVLPSGRSLFYPFPRLVNVELPWGSTRRGIRFYAVDGVTKQWKEFALFGGLQMQNVVQAAARDVMMEAVVRCEEAGYANVLRVHDEGIFEAPIGSGDEEEFHRLFVQPPAWAPDLPIAADGWVGDRYHK